MQRHFLTLEIDITAETRAREGCQTQQCSQMTLFSLASSWRELRFVLYLILSFLRQELKTTTIEIFFKNS